MSKTTATLYLHGNKETNWEVGEKLGLTGEALKMFKHALTEVEFTLEVDTETGLAEILKVAGRGLAKDPKRPPVDFSGLDAAIERAMRALVNPTVEVDPKVNLAILIQCIKGIRLVMEQTEVMNDHFDKLLDALTTGGE